MIRRIDRVLSGTALFVPAAMFVFAVIVLFAQIERDRLDRTGRDRHLYLQGNLVYVPSGAESLPDLAAVRRDGRLDERHDPDSIYRNWELRVPYDPSGWPAAFGGEVAIRPDTFIPDYRRPSGDILAWAGDNRWKVTTKGEILRCAPDRSIEGSLVDEGWRHGRREPCSFRQAEWWGTSGIPEGASGRVSATYFAYVSGGVLHLVDFKTPAIRRVLSGLDGGWYSVACHSAESQLWVLTGTRIHRIPVDAPDKAASFEPPPRFRQAARYEGAVGTDGRLILRVEEAGSRTEQSVRYHVAILDAAGSVKEEYPYELRVAPPNRLYADADFTDSTRLAAIKSGVFGRLSTFLMPAAGWSSVLLMELKTPTTGFSRLREDFLEYFSFPAAFVLGILLAAVVAWRLRRLGAGWGAISGWAAFVAAFGIPGALTWWFLAVRERLERCACGRTRSPRRPACPDCGAGAEAPARLGIEILKPA